MKSFLSVWRVVAAGIVVTLGSANVAFAETGTLVSPLNPRFSSVQTFIEGALRAMVIVALPILTVFIVLSGFYFVAAQGNPEKLAKAQRNFTYVILGAALVLGAWTLSNLIASSVMQVMGR